MPPYLLNLQTIPITINQSSWVPFESCQNNYLICGLPNLSLPATCARFAAKCVLEFRDFVNTRECVPNAKWRQRSRNGRDYCHHVGHPATCANFVADCVKILPYITLTSAHGNAFLRVKPVEMRTSHSGTWNFTPIRTGHVQCHTYVRTAPARSSATLSWRCTSGSIPVNVLSAANSAMPPSPDSIILNNTLSGGTNINVCSSATTATGNSLPST